MKLLKQARKSGASPPLQRVKLDWRQYFYEFCRRHGGNPVEHKGRLIFGDGWAYSATDYRGPEWRPPDDEKELKGLKRTYWALRRRLVSREAKLLAAEMETWAQMQVGRDAPLQRLSHRWEGEGAEAVRVRDSKELSLTAMRERLDWLEQDAAECGKQLDLLNRPNTATSRSMP